MPVQRCTVHKHRNLLAHAPERLHEEITADYNDMIYAATREEMEVRRTSAGRLSMCSGFQGGSLPNCAKAPADPKRSTIPMIGARRNMASLAKRESLP